MGNLIIWILYGVYPVYPVDQYLKKKNNNYCNFVYLHELISYRLVSEYSRLNNIDNFSEIYSPYYNTIDGSFYD